MKTTIHSTKFNFPEQKSFYRGKVRDVYNIRDELLIMVATDRISAFDVILPRQIPYKGQVLNQIAAKFLSATSSLVPNWILDVPDPNVTIGIYCKPYPVEMVIRGYLSGHSWRIYKNGQREICGNRLPDGLKENDKLLKPIITPTTKAKQGHDEDITPHEIIENNLVNESEYLQIENYTNELFQFGTDFAKEKGLLLVDTKYEFGKSNDKIFLIDEVHTPDSSRYFYSDGYRENLEKGLTQKQLSKEFVREWLMERNFQGLQGQSIPVMSDDFVNLISERYIELYEKITGEQFQRANTTGIMKRIETNILDYLNYSVKPR